MHPFHVCASRLAACATQRANTHACQHGWVSGSACHCRWFTLAPAARLLAFENYTLNNFYICTLKVSSGLHAKKYVNRMPLGLKSILDMLRAGWSNRAQPR